jgi:hypothetical protein
MGPFGKTHLFDFFTLKKPKIVFWGKLENEAFPKKLFLAFFIDKNSIFQRNPKQALNSIAACRKPYNTAMRSSVDTSPLLHRKSTPSSLLTSAGEGTYPDSIHLFSIISSLS